MTAAIFTTAIGQNLMWGGAPIAYNSVLAAQQPKGGGGPPPGGGFIELESGAGFFELEDGSGGILLE